MIIPEGIAIHLMNRKKIKKIKQEKLANVKKDRIFTVRY